MLKKFLRKLEWKILDKLGYTKVTPIVTKGKFITAIAYLTIIDDKENIYFTSLKTIDLEWFDAKIGDTLNITHSVKVAGNVPE